MDLDRYKSFIIDLARTSGEIIRPYFTSPDLSVELKGDDTPVTVADRRAEKVMREMIERTYPEHGIIGEEYGSQNADAEFVWVLDPIDGTISFANGCPLFGTLIGLMQRGRPILGVIHQPVSDQLCMGDGRQTTLNGRRVSVREGRTLDESLILTTDLAAIDRYQNLANFDTLRRRAATFRTWGDCYGYLLLASGYAEGMMDPVMNPWDILPLIPVVEGAGGVITAWDGGDPVHGQSCLAATPALHGEMLNILNTQASLSNL